MNKQAIFDVIVGHARFIVPALADRMIAFDDSLRAIGANSVDRSEIIMMSLESLNLDIPLVELARAENIGELADIMHSRAVSV